MNSGALSSQEEVDYFREEYDDDENYSFTSSIQKISEWWNDLIIPDYCDEEGYPLSFQDAEKKN